MLKANYHTHTYLCGHATGDVIDYVNEAIRLGFKELGMSDHAHTPEYFMSEDEYHHNYLEEIMTDDDFDNIYVPRVLEAKKNPNIKVFLGLETEYFPEFKDYFVKLRKKVDYLVLGEHFFNYKGSNYSPYDPFTPRLAEVYTDIVIEAMETGLYTIFAHPDLFLMNYNGENGHRVFDKTAEICSKRIIEAAIKNDVYLEINANGIAKGARRTDSGKEQYLYPREEFWNLVSGTKAKVVIGADAHKPEALGYEAVEKAIEFAKQFDLNMCDFVEFKK